MVHSEFFSCHLTAESVVSYEKQLQSYNAIHILTQYYTHGFYFGIDFRQLPFKRRNSPEKIWGEILCHYDYTTGIFMLHMWNKK